MNCLTIAAPASAGQFVVPALAGMRRQKAELQTASACRRRLKAELRAGFTLVELLITIAIISILVTMSMGALFMAQESARYERTQGLIGKLHNVVIDRWETYRTRRLILLPSVPPTPSNRLYGMRELMRMEMPDRYEDLVFTNTFIQEPPMRHTYERRILAAWNKYKSKPGNSSVTYNQYVNILWNNPNESAECLYLFISASMPADERAEFRDKDYADTNDNSMPEFIDAWGKPIRFLRWAPGVQSDVQWFESYQDANNNGRFDSGESYTDTNGDGNWDGRDPINYHDPFDPYGLEMGDTVDPIPSSRFSKPTTGIARDSGEPDVPYWGYTILPFIYSAGPDSEYGIHECLNSAPASAATLLAKNRNPYCRYLVSGTYYWRGEPDVITNGIVHLDNIHNHNPVGFGK